MGHKTIYATERYVRLTAEVYPRFARLLTDKYDHVFGAVGGHGRSD
jgi:hypothetical protein